MKATKRKLIPKRLPTLDNEKPSIADQLIMQKLQAEKQTWDRVLTTALGRIPTPADYKRCKRIREVGDTANYTLYFDSVALGRMIFEPESLVFQPAKRFR